MNSGRGGKREGAGRPATGRLERISVQPTKTNLKWLREQKKSYSSILNRLMDEKRSSKQKGIHPVSPQIRRTEMKKTLKKTGGFVVLELLVLVFIAGGYIVATNSNADCEKRAENCEKSMVVE